MSNKETRITCGIVTSGPALSICGYCRKIVGTTTLLLSISDYPCLLEVLNAPFKRIEYCQCIEKTLMGAKIG